MKELIAASPFGTVNLPPEITSRFGTVESGAVGVFINLVLRLLIIIAGIYTVLNLVLAGYAFLSAGDDPKKIAGAWAKIWQSLLGLAVSAGAFVIAAIIGWLLFRNPFFLLTPEIPTP